MPPTSSCVRGTSGKGLFCSTVTNVLNSPKALTGTMGYFLAGLMQARTIREFDERFTSHLFGYKTCIDYYRDASPAKKLPQTSVPILCLNAADDPFSPQSAIPVSIVQALPNVALLLTAHGGHIAFLQGLFPRGESYMECLFGQFVQAVFEHPGDIKKACGVDKDEPNEYQSDREE
ncbi:hypothetical protein ILYODFUR_014035 [Ilyodon furcidens]|uniref:AB hydrolase-1 domain-containing protein n=1 Tax=Ilyodon furcidens TaxID=33524 RepID=A0ABV0UU31_9TELE